MSAAELSAHSPDTKFCQLSQARLTIRRRFDLIDSMKNEMARSWLHPAATN
jgi:hypothetical protein